MSLATPAVPETLRAPPRRWLSRLWVRVSLVLLLIFAISFFAWWLPRRTKVAVWWNGGRAFCDPDGVRARAVLGWIDPNRKLSGRALSWLYWVNNLISSDADITRVHLNDSKVGNDWLVRLKGFPNLTLVGLDDRQLGTGLNDLHDCVALKKIDITSATGQHLVELRWLPQLESLTLCEPQRGDIGLQSLTALSKLNHLYFMDCQYTDDLWEALPDLPSLESLFVQNCTGFVDDDLRCLHRLPNLKILLVDGTTSPVGDVALTHLTQLNRLETLALCIPWPDVTDEGLAKLAAMKSLKQIIVRGHQCSPDQLQRLGKALPNCSITVQ